MNQHTTQLDTTTTRSTRVQRLATAATLGILLIAIDAVQAADNTGGVVSTVQSSSRPFGLSVVGQVMQAGSDANSANFQQNVLPGALQFIQANIPERRINTPGTGGPLSVDFSRLRLQNDYNVRAYFVSEGAGYLNTLGVNTTGAGVSSGNPQLIFPNASSTLGTIHSGVPGTRTSGEPVLPGDFVNLGQMGRGTFLDFFLIANGAAGGRDVFTTSGTGNPDGINHVASFTPRAFVVPQLNSPYIFLAFEDLRGGGDRDYNDTIFAVDVGRGTVNYLLGTPEPALWLTLAAFLGVAYWAKRRMAPAQPAVGSAA